MWPCGYTPGRRRPCGRCWAEGFAHAEFLDTALAPYLADDRRTSTLPDADIAPDDYATITYTSGTTGRPEGTIASHRNHVTNLTNWLLAGAVNARLAAAALPAGGEVSPPQPVALQTFPFFHSGGLTGLCLLTAMGARVALVYRWDPHRLPGLPEHRRLLPRGGPQEGCDDPRRR